MKNLVIAIAFAAATVSSASIVYANSDAHACDNIHDAKEKAHCIEEQAKGHK